MASVPLNSVSSPLPLCLMISSYSSYMSPRKDIPSCAQNDHKSDILKWEKIKSIMKDPRVTVLIMMALSSLTKGITDSMKQTFFHVISRDSFHNFAF